jgi:hypothetical protein
MRMINEAAAGEYASNKARYLRDDIAKAKDRALQALRDGRFADYDKAKAEAEELGCTDDIEAWACNIVSEELDKA